MTTNRTLAPLASIALAVVVVLTGCTQPRPTPTDIPPFTSATPTPTPTAISVAPDKTDAPKDQDEAWAEANDTITRYAEVRYSIEADGGEDPDRIEPFANAAALKTVQEIAKGFREKGYSLQGGPAKWEPNASASSFGDVVPSKGKLIKNGVVYARGCWDVSEQEAVAKDGSQPQTSPTRLFALQFNVVYHPDSKTWKVTDVSDVTNEAGANKC